MTPLHVAFERLCLRATDLIAVDLCRSINSKVGAALALGFLACHAAHFVYGFPLILDIQCVLTVSIVLLLPISRYKVGNRSFINTFCWPSQGKKFEVLPWVVTACRFQPVRLSPAQLKESFERLRESF